jgi:uncharacterized SAM-binding protein YcdF (DUF218 family)
MFFLLSKVLAFALKPLNWAVVLLLLAVFRPRRRRAFLLAGTAALLLFSNPWLANQAARAWEPPPADAQGVYEVGILLGGFSDFEVVQPDSILPLNRAANRFAAALTLYHAGHLRHILVSGGTSRITGGYPAEAPEARRMLLQNGVPDSAIWIESGSRNTMENALYTKRLLDSIAPAGGRRLLITSAWHLPRASRCFEQAGLPCEGFGADYLSENRRANWFQWLEPDWEALLKWELLVKEWVGWVVYEARNF